MSAMLFSHLINKINTTNIKINGCIHVGAHWGQEYNIYKQMGINDLIFYEPLKTNFDVLKTKVGPEVVLRNKALGNTSGYIEMHVETNNYGQSSSILEPKLHLQQYPNIIFDKKETVEIQRLDEEEFDRSIFNFLNVDVQGYELEVFKGADQTLYNVDYIISEVNGVEMYGGCARFEELTAFLQYYGFSLGHVEWHQNSRTWGNAIYWKNK